MYCLYHTEKMKFFVRQEGAREVFIKSMNEMNYYDDAFIIMPEALMDDVNGLIEFIASSCIAPDEASYITLVPLSAGLIPDFLEAVLLKDVFHGT